ncbi:cilia- and flagella-associated protein 97-like [Hylaeus anthracinus]|uniref:cilia- and flagella-associated protein 97-like n=1 Tax=Hylaeus anthracinus TaxID=313031 RepID=UPI0023B9B5C2|nr:cilia- and flagella-associated protein 97-like [Hylaeus anthracinus]
MEANCECQYTLTLTNEVVRGQFSETKDNFNHVPSIHEVVEEDTDEEYICDQESATSKDVENTTDLTKETEDNDSNYSNESFCSDESCDESEETNITTRTFNESYISSKITDRECAKEDVGNEETRCNRVIHDDQVKNSVRCGSSITEDKSASLTLVKSKKKNMTFTGEQVRKIEWENQLLLKKIMAQQRPKEKLLRENIPQLRMSSSEINRKKLQKKIESENILLLQRLQHTKSRVMNMSKPGCRQTIL